jgi:hypothetical protein
MTAMKSSILIIDDEPEDGRNLQRDIAERAEVVIRTPEEFGKRDLERADLVLVDHELDEWSGATSSLTSPPNGLALSAVIREQINQLTRRNVTAVALWSGQVDRIAAPFPSALRNFAFARVNNLEWVFAKGQSEVATGVISLAEAVQQLPRSWPEDPQDASKRLGKLLGLREDCPYFPTAADDVEGCHPPIHELSEATHGLTVIRWIAQRILPYPAFLVDRFGLASRLRLQPDQLDALLAGKSAFSEAVREVEYRGVLSGLYGSHWWRAGLDDLAFEWTEGTADTARLQMKVSQLADRPLEFLPCEVVSGIDEGYRPVALIPIADAVRLQLDDWPPFADAAWAERDRVAETPSLRGLVLPLDDELLNTV